MVKIAKFIENLPGEKEKEMIFMDSIDFVNPKDMEQVTEEILDALKKEGVDPTKPPFDKLLKNFSFIFAFDTNDGRSFKIEVRNDGRGTLSGTVIVWRTVKGPAALIYNKKLSTPLPQNPTGKKP